MTNPEIGKSEGRMLLNECFDALALIVEYDMKDFSTHQHAIRVGEGSVLMADKMGLDSSKFLKMYYAGLLHDIGKISLDLKLLSRKGRLSDEEFETNKKGNKLNEVASKPRSDFVCPNINIECMEQETSEQDQSDSNAMQHEDKSSVFHDASSFILDLSASSFLTNWYSSYQDVTIHTIPGTIIQNIRHIHTYTHT